MRQSFVCAACQQLLYLWPAWWFHERRNRRVSHFQVGTEKLLFGLRHLLESVNLLGHPKREREKEQVGRWGMRFDSAGSTRVVPHNAFPPSASPLTEKTFSTASYTCFFFPFYICCCGLIIIPRPSIKNDDNSVVTSVVDVCWCLSGCAAIDWLKGNKKKGVGSPIGFLRQTEEKIKRLFLLLLLSNRPCQSVRGRELIESV